tara:strand:+ start:11536 stop:11943 length:408 start_codon:yes stop_codon:yes gene_type:complete
MPKKDPSAKDIVLKYFPFISDDAVEHIMWGLTGWPGFWHIPEDGNTPMECFETQVRQAKEKVDQGISIDQQYDEGWDQNPFKVKQFEKIIKALSELGYHQQLPHYNDYMRSLHDALSHAKDRIRAREKKWAKKAS